MLSTVSIFAQGSTGQEVFEVRANGFNIAFVQNIPTTELGEFQFDVPDSVTADDIQIKFINDIFDPANGIDRNVTVDRIELNDRIFKTDNAAVFSTGTWTEADGIQDGFGRGDTLNSNGFFQYSEDGFGGPADTRTVVIIDAAGFGDSIDFELQVDGERVQNYSLSPRAGQSTGVFTATLDETVSADRIRVAFTNDLTFTDPISGSTIDRNLLINFVTIDGEVFKGNDLDVFSTGTFLNGGIQDGFGRGNTLHANGFFQFADRTLPLEPNVRSEITIDATAVGLNVDVVAFRIDIEGANPGSQVFTFGPGETNDPNFVRTFTVSGTVRPSQVRITFFSDLFTPELDRNLRVNSLTINGVSFDPADDSVFSTGTFREEDGVVAGFGRGNILHSNGFFQFA